MEDVMKRWLLSLWMLLLAGCSLAGTPADPVLTEPPETSDPGKAEVVKLKDFGPAPELANEIWLNTEQPLRLADLRGKVVAIDMWTFG
jgi:hypothetical protein